MSQNVGQIDLGLNINRQMFNNQLKGLAGGAENSAMFAFKGLGKKIGKVLGITAFGMFTKSCLDLGSDLAEVQNVVDVTFGSMSNEINKFASTAITQFGLSETSAKRYASTMGAMLKSMGITTDKALEMSKAMTGLSADIASFYNISSEEAFTKIRSGISGETEPLKQLGINLNIANLEAYAFSQGITKAYNKMSQQEQTMLRYNYLLKVTADAQGDFARTSDSWANQTRILSEQFNALKASIGEGLIAAFTPVVKWLNIIIAKLRVAAGYFKAFMELIFGKQADSGGGAAMGAVADATGGIADSAGAASDAVEGVGDAAKKAGKKAKGALANFDELNQLATADTGSGDSSSGGGIGSTTGAVDVDFGQIDTSTSEISDKVTSMIDGMIADFNRLKKIFKDGFKIGIGGDYQKKLNDISKSIEGIKKSLKNIFTDNDVVSAANNMFNSLVLCIGQIVGSFTSVGLTIAQNLIGGINNYLEQNTQYIKDRLIGIFNVGTEINVLIGDLFTNIADIFSVFGGETAQQITANIIGIFSNGFLGILQLALQFGKNIIKCIAEPIEQNKDKIKLALENTFKPIETITGMLKDFVTNTFESIFKAYEEYIEPAFKNISEGISKIVGAVLDAYNTYIAPTIDKMANKWREFYDKHLQPTIDKAIEVLGKLVLAVSELWNNCLAPFVAWAAEFMAPFLSAAFESINTAFIIVATAITDAVKGLLNVFGGLIDFLTGIFTGNWTKVWNGAKAILKGVFDTFKAICITPLNNILSWVTGIFTKGWTNAWEGCKKVFKGVFDSLVGIVKGPLNLIISAINAVIRGLNKLSIDIPEWVPGFGGKTWGVNISTIPKLAKGGIVDQPTLAMVGEAGKEAVVPLENNTEWVGKVASLIASALLPVLGGGSNNSSDTNRDIVVQLDSIELVRAFLPTLIKEAKRQGVTIGV